MAKWALRCFYRECLKVTGWTRFRGFADRRTTKTLPVVLSRVEVQRVLDCVREARFAVCLRLDVYTAGCAVGEAVSLGVKDILGAAKSPPCLHIRNAKGGKDRYVPVALAMVEELRAWWRTHRNPKLVFPSARASEGPSCGQSVDGPNH